MTVKNVLALVALLIFLSASPSRGSGRISGEEIIRAFRSDPSSLLVNGFGRALAGETIDYHSVNELARLALLSRTTDGMMAIEWRTGPAPAGPGSRFVTFFWLAALAGSKGVHSFSMSINGNQWIRFTSPADSGTQTWTLDHPSGGSLSFAAMETDRFGDSYGYMFLKLPRASIREGDSLTIRVAGEAAGSSCWYMTFEHPLVKNVVVRPLPVLMSEGGNVRQVVRVTLERYGLPENLSVGIGAANRVAVRCEWGATKVLVPADTVSGRRTRILTVESESKVVAEIPVLLRPVVRRVLYLLPHSHTDIGYSDYQAVVEQKHMRYLEEAIAIARRTSRNPEGAQFRWNLEVLWPLESYMRRASEEQKATVVDAIRRGWIGVNGLYANELTGLCRPEELFHLTDYARRISAEYGLTVNAAMITDIPAYTSNIVTALAESGIRYFSSGPNYSPDLPDGGDRVGYALHTLGDRPFYWESQSGQSRVLFWMTTTGYSLFHGWIMGRLSRSNPEPIYRYLDLLDSTNYPYELVQLRYTIDGDNGPPDPELADFVKDWNSRYLSPRYVIATTSELFEEFERRYGSTLPIRRGDLTPYWEDGAVSTAAEVAQNRRAAEKLVQAGVLYSMIASRRYPDGIFAAAWRNVVLFDEHTWGAWNSISEPDSPSVIAQWDYKRAMVVQAARQADDLVEGVAPRPGGLRSPLTSVDVVNTNSWARADLIVIPARWNIAGPRVKDDRGDPLPSQVLANGDLAVLVTDVSPMGARRLTFGKGKPHRPAIPVVASTSALSGPLLRATLNTGDGSIGSLLDFSLRKQGVDLVDRERGSGLNEYLEIPGKDPSHVRRDSIVRISIGEPGPLVASLIVESSPPGCRSLSREIRLTAGLQRLDIVDVMEKTKVRDKESVHFGFPFRVPGGIPRIDEGLEVIRPETDQLPGACRDYFSVQRWVDISSDTGGITWANPDAPLVEVGELTSEKPGPSGYRAWRDTIARAQNIFSYVMNNYWHTNYKADQEGMATFRYSIRPHGSFDRAAATRFGIERSQPLLVVAPLAGKKVRAPLFTVTPASVIATAVNPSADGTGWVLRVFNAGDSPVDVALEWRDKDHVSVFLSDLFERRKEQLNGPIHLPPSGIVTLKIE